MISMQTCTHPTQVHTPACISTYVSSCLYSPELLAHHTPTPVTHLKRTSIHTQDVKRHRHIQIEGWEHAVLKHLFPYLFLAHFCHNYNYLSNQRIVLIPPPASEFVLKPSLRQGHGKAREAQAASWGRRGRTSGSVFALLSNVSPRLFECRRRRARGLTERRAKPGADEEARQVAWCQGAGR